MMDLFIIDIIGLLGNERYPVLLDFCSTLHCVTSIHTKVSCDAVPEIDGLTYIR